MAAQPVIFLKEVQGELKKVSWPTRQETARLTLIVVGVSVAVGVFVGGLDFIFVKIMEVILPK